MTTDAEHQLLEATLDELKHLYRDCWTTGDEPRVLLEALFPQQASDLWPVS